MMFQFHLNKSGLFKVDRKVRKRENKEENNLYLAFNQNITLILCFIIENKTLMIHVKHFSN